MNKPMDIIPSQKELDECLAWWQHRLYLDSWEINAKIVDAVTDLDGKEVKDVVGLNQFVVELSQSYIQLLSAEAYDKLYDPKCGHFCMEKTLVHELLHCIYNWISGNERYECIYTDEKEHQQLENMAKSLIMAKYNLDYDYFRKRLPDPHQTPVGARLDAGIYD